MAPMIKASILRHFPWGFEHLEDEIAVERCLAIFGDGEFLGQTTRTPGQDQELVAGLLFTEGVIEHSLEIENVAITPRDELTDRADVHLADTARTRRLAQGGGVGDRPLLRQRPLPPPGETTAPLFYLDDLALGEMMELMEDRQEIFRRTGATHCAALFDASGEVLAFAEDIGRHNALDKIIGDALRQKTLGRGTVITISSRLSLELVKKVARTGVAVFAGISVATSQAVRLAESLDITLIGRVRKKSMNVYCHGYRVMKRRAPDEADELDKETIAAFKDLAN